MLGRRLTQSPRHLSTVCWGGVVIRWAPITSDSAIPRCGFLGRKQTRGRTYIRPRTWFLKLWLFKNWSSSSRCCRSIWVDRKLSLCDLVLEIRDGQRLLLFARSEITIIVRGRRATGRSVVLGALVYPPGRGARYIAWTLDTKYAWPQLGLHLNSLPGS